MVSENFRNTYQFKMLFPFTLFSIGLCPIGHFYNLTSATCNACPKGHYQNMPGKSYCVPCPLGTSTVNIAAISQSQCKGMPFCILNIKNNKKG